MAPSTPTAAPQDGLVERLTERAAREDYGAGLREDLRRALALIAAQEARIAELERERDDARQNARTINSDLARAEAALAAAQRERDDALRLHREKMDAIDARIAAEFALARAQRDAERYRWLRDKSVPPHNFYISVPVEFADVKYYTAQEVDAAIDAARGKE